jgi:aquaporin related protein
VVTGVFDTEHWIYWVGPAVGAIIAVLFYQFIKILEYEVANPGQDDDDKDQEVKEEIEKVREGSQEPDLERGPAGGLVSNDGVRAVPTVASIRQLRKKKALEGQGFGGRGENTY